MTHKDQYCSNKENKVTYASNTRMHGSYIQPQGKALYKLTLADHYIQKGTQTQEIQLFVPNLYCTSNFHSSR